VEPIKKGTKMNTGEKLLSDESVIRYQNLLALHRELEELTSEFKKQYDAFETRKAEIHKQAELL